MAKKDRQQRKKKERQERLRKEKHLRLFGPGNSSGEPDHDDDGGEYDLDLPPATATERAMRQMMQGPGLLGTLRSWLPGGRREVDPSEQARELAFDAMEAADQEEAIDLARRAVALDPDCTDALNILALNAGSTRQEQIKLLEQAVSAAQRNLGGPAYFEENREHFWGLLETRPYMRARSALADLLRDQGRLAEAIGHYEALLDLNPNDNQGLRDVLIGCYFQADNLDGVRRLFEQYEGEFSAIFGYAHVLERFLSGDLEEAARFRDKAREENPHVEAFLLGKKKLPRRLPEYMRFGDETEAIHCAVYLGEAWQRQPRALSWLRSSGN